MEKLKLEQFDEAIDLLFVYIQAVEGSSAIRVVEIAQKARYKLAMLLISERRKAEAAKVLNDYIAIQPASHVRKARKMLVACYYDEKMYEQCVPAVSNALYFNDNPVQYKIADDAGRVRFRADDDDLEEEEPDLPYSQEELTMLQFTLGEAYFNLGDKETDRDKAKEYFNACMDAFTYVIERTDNEQRKGYSIMQMINALNELQSFDKIIDWIPVLYKTPARFDIRVNLALLRVAAALFEAGEYDSALPMYRMILPRDELIEYQEKKIRQLRVEAGLPAEFGEELSSDEMLLFGEAKPEREVEEEAVMLLASGIRVGVAEEEDEQEAIQPQEVLELDALLDTLKSMEPYENYVNFQMAQLYKAVERYWESVKFYDAVASADNGGEIGERSRYESVAVLIDKLGQREDGEARALSYLESTHVGIYPRLVAYVLTGYYQKAKAWEDVKKLRPYIETLERTQDVLEVRYDTELYFMQGIAELMTQQYSNAVERFGFVIEEYPETDQEANSLFWQGFSYLCLDNPTNAFECFERYTRDFANLPPERSMLDEAYYQGGICLFGMDKLDEAKDRFSYVIDTYGTNSTVFPDSCNMRGDILGSLGGTNLDLAISDYKNAFVNATKASQASYATFKMCDIFKADEQYYGLDYIIEAVNLYLAQWGDRGADIAKALFWIGRTKIQQERYEEAADSYMQAVIDYGGDLRQDGVDMMIPELVKIGTIFLNEEQSSMIQNRLRIAMETTDNEVLRLRLLVTLARFDHSEVELGKRLIAELPNLENASPPVLSTICEASFELQDYSRSAELLRVFKYNFEDSEYMRSAYKLRASGLLSYGDYEETLAVVTDAQEEYGEERSMSWAQLMKAKVLMELGKLDEARDQNKNIMAYPQWRGEPYAQATYQLGEVEEKSGNLLAAHGYYQRAYVQYKGLADWGAKGYLAAANILKKLSEDMSLSMDERELYADARVSTLKAMLLDKYANKGPLAEEARTLLGPTMVADVESIIASGIETNIVVSLEAETSTDENNDPATKGDA
jgi:tetratricopeptide (TPR) repeat protein